MSLDTYRKNYQKYINFINKYKVASNASTGSEVDANANVQCKNITTMSGEIPKKVFIGTNRLLMINKLSEMFGEDVAQEYIRQLESHEIYKHDETSANPYCVSISMYPFLLNGLKQIGGASAPPKHLASFCGSFINLVFAVAAQFAGAVATPEFLTYFDYFARKEYGEDYYLHSNDKATIGLHQQTIDDVLIDAFQQVTYSLNQPAAARNYQSVFWNIAYFDEPYFRGIFNNFIFPDGTEPKWESVSWLQKRYMEWFNQERLKCADLTFPVETLNLLYNGDDYVDKDWFDFGTSMYAKGHSFFTYISDSVDSLASCCFDGSQKVLTKSSDGVFFGTFKELYEASYSDTKRNFTVFHNGSWVKGKPIRLPRRKLYKIITANKKQILVTDNHVNVTLNGEKTTEELTTSDYLMFNCLPLDTFPEKDEGLKYEDGYLIGMYLGDGSMSNEEADGTTTTVHLSLNENKYLNTINILQKAMDSLKINAEIKLYPEKNNTYPVQISSTMLAVFVRKYVSGKYSYEKRLNLDCLLQSKEFRQGILDGYYVTDGGNSNRIYTTSQSLTEDVECLMTSLGLHSIIDVADRTNEKVKIRGEEYNRNFPTYCIRWYDPKNRRSMSDVFIVRNNSTYFKITSIEPYYSDDEYTYCFEMSAREPYFTLPNGIITHNCRLKNEIQKNTFSYTLGAGGIATGSKGVITININRLVQNATKSKTNIEDAIRIQIQKNHKYLLAYNEIIKDYFRAKMLPIYDAGFIKLSGQYLTNGINGFVEGAEFLGIDISPNEEYFKYGESILRPIFEENRRAKTDDIMFNTEFVPAENLGVKNAKWDKEDGYLVPRNCYNSYFYRVEDDSTNIVDKFILHGNRLTKYLDGGSALHCNLDEHLSQEQYKKLLKTAIKTGCSYFTFNIPNTVCNDCGYIEKRPLKVCPKCGSTNLDYLTRVIGYLKRVSAFSEPRQKEASQRFYDHGTTQV